MKKFFKFGCLGIIALIVLIIILAVAFGGEEEKVNTGAEGEKTTEASAEATDDGSKTVDASSVNGEALGLKVGLGEVKITKDKLQVGINIENTNEDMVSFYPDQGSAVVGDMQLDANLFLTDGDIGGEIQGGVKQEGIIEFLVPEGKEITVDDVKEIKLVLGDVFDETDFDSKEITLNVEVK